MTKALLAAAAILVAFSTSPASADTVRTDCRALRVGNTYERACVTTVEHEAPAPVVEAPSSRGPSTVETVSFDPIDAARRNALPKHDPHPIDLCPPPLHMTGADGCQPGRR